jgi:hypothetical protein
VFANGRSAWNLATLLAAAYVLVCVHSSALLFQDYPAHLARAVVMEDLFFHHGAQFDAAFQYQFMIIPYILGDLILIAAVHLFGTTAATAIWTTLTLLSLPLAVLFYLWASRTVLDNRAIVLMLCLYLSTDWFFLLGFLNFRLAVALIIFALALVQGLRRQWSVGTFAGYCVLVALGYLMHLAFLVFLAAAVGATGLLRLYLRTTRLRRELAFCTPIGVVLAWHVGSSAYYPAQHEVIAAKYVWGTLHWKLRRLDWDLIRFDERVDVMFILVLAIGLLWTIRRRLTRGALANRDMLDMLVLATTFLALYFVFPMTYGDPGYVDVRALALAGPCLILFAMQLQDNSTQRRSPNNRAVMAAAVFAVANLLYFWKGAAADSAWLTQYRSVVAALPRGASVLPVYTRIREGTRFRYREVDSFAVIDRGAYIPYMFSGDQGQPMKYFRYVNRRYAPPDNWYTEASSMPVDWQAIACDYEFLLVLKPFEPSRIGLATKTVAESSSATLLSVDRNLCSSVPGLTEKQG